MICEKIHGQFYLDDHALEFITSVASFYHISRSEVVAWAIDSSVKSFEKAYRQATKRIYSRRAHEKTQKVQAAPSRTKKAKNPSAQAQKVQQLVFDFTALGAEKAPRANESIF